MTVVVGVATKTGVVLAADSQASYLDGGYAKRMLRHPKVIQISDVLAFGYHGYGRFAQAMEFGFQDLDDPPLGMDELEWAVRYFIPFLAAVLTDAGCLYTDLETNVEGFGEENGFLLAVRGRILSVDGTMCADENIRPFDALGSGMEVAWGALENAIDGNGLVDDREAERAAHNAVVAAISGTALVGGDVMSVRTVTYTDAERALARRVLRR